LVPCFVKGPANHISSNSSSVMCPWRYLQVLRGCRKIWLSSQGIFESGIGSTTLLSWSDSKSEKSVCFANNFVTLLFRVFFHNCPMVECSFSLLLCSRSGSFIVVVVLISRRVEEAVDQARYYLCNGYLISLLLSLA